MFINIKTQYFFPVGCAQSGKWSVPLILQKMLLCLSFRLKRFYFIFKIAKFVVVVPPSHPCSPREGPTKVKKSIKKCIGEMQ
jgi:hypothetical protein